MNALLRHRATITRQVATKDANHETARVATEVATDVPCLVQSQGRNRMTTVHGVTLDWDGIAFFRPGQDIQAKTTDDYPDTITVDSVQWQVLTVDDAAGQGHHLEARLKRVG